MAIIFRCNNCGHRYNVLDHMAGKRVRCKDCGQAIRVPMSHHQAPAQGKTRCDASPGQSTTSFQAIVNPSKDSANTSSTKGKRILKQTAASRPATQSTEPPALDAADVQPSTPLPGRLKRMLRKAGWIGLLALGLLVGLTLCYPTIRPVLEDLIGLLGYTAPTLGNWTTINAIPQPHFPEMPPLRPIAEGINSCEVILSGHDAPGQNMRMRIYMPPGTHSPGSFPCVLMAPSDRPLLAGGALTDDDNDLHLAYARKGFIVVYYELDGKPSDDFRKMNRASVHAIRQFMEARAGLVNARNAMEYVLAKVPAVDPDRIYCAGHGASGTIALLLAAMSARIKACVAFGPICDVSGYVDSRLMQQLERKISGAKHFFADASPTSHLDAIQCPVYIFCAEDDDQASFAAVRSFAAGMKAADKEIEFVPVHTGGHRRAMLARGIDDSIQWLRGVRVTEASGGLVPEESVFHEPPSEPLWLPDPTAVDQLAPEISIGSYRIRPPKGLKLTSEPNVSQTYLHWQSDDGTVSFSVRIEPRKNPFQRQPWVVTGGTPGQFENLYTIIAPGGILARGRIGEIRCTCVVWRDAIGASPPTQRLELAGLDQDRWIIIQGRCGERDATWMEILMSAARTFRKPLANELYVDPFRSN